MKLQFKHQQFQIDAAKAVIDVFNGQPNSNLDFTWTSNLYAANAPIQLSDEMILENLNRVQRRNQIDPSKELKKIDGSYNLTIEMETGVGKTYTYIKTMHELNQKYGWKKFIIIVPSVAIREGVFKTFQITEEHFAEEYETKIHFFIYNSTRLEEIENFVSDHEISAMIINSQAFNSTGKDARRIRMALDEFQSEKPIEKIAQTNPILIIDEPQSLEGRRTREGLRDFHPILILRYSATHREIFNMVYRLDAMDAYNKHLVKKICVVGIKSSGSMATEGFVYLERINLSSSAPTATIHFDFKSSNGIQKRIQTISEGFDLYKNSGELDEYQNNFIVRFIDGRDNSIEFLNGIKIFAGDVIGNVDEDQLRRIQIRETIKAHLKRESQLFSRGIKVLSLFFIDEVANYRIYDSHGNPQNGNFAIWFEEEYSQAVKEIQPELFNPDYLKYLESIPVEKTHAGYFSIDGKGKFTNGKISNRGEKTSDDVSAYDLIMKNKELLLDQNPNRSPVRFIFSHSALREGWDNPNVFQICTLKHSNSDIRKRQEVGRGLRLCVDQTGARMDENLLGGEVHQINKLTIIASEGYDEFTQKLQTEIAEAVIDRPRQIDQNFFTGKKLPDGSVIDEDLSRKIDYSMIKRDYLDLNGNLTDKYFEDKKSGTLEFIDEVSDFKESIVEMIDMIYQPQKFEIENSRSQNVTAKFEPDRFAKPEFQSLWNKINLKTIYEVNFDSESLVKRSIDLLNRDLHVTEIFFSVETGELKKIRSKDELKSGESFEKESSDHSNIMTAASKSRSDLVGKMMSMTDLSRKTIIQILGGIDQKILARFKLNPEEFILKASRMINSQKAQIVIEQIKYHVTNETYDSKIFIDANLNGILNRNAILTQKNLYDYLVFDSTIEKKFAEELESDREVIIYVKLPSGFYVPTPVGKYNPDWAIVFRKDDVKNIYFIAETKGSMDSVQLRLIEDSKIHCAREHFKSISNDSIRYDVVSSYHELLKMIME